MSTTSPTADLLERLRDADADVIRARLAELAGEERALRTLLRAVLARDRQRERLMPRERQERRP